jgi:Zn-finger nucleic acid-binding protein
MESFEDVLVPVELKYCERCGGLWLRPKEETEIYCPECVPKMAEMPQPRRKRVLVVAVNSIDEMEACLAELAGVCAEGGNA